MNKCWIQAFLPKSLTLIDEKLIYKGNPAVFYYETYMHNMTVNNNLLNDTFRVSDAVGFSKISIRLHELTQSEFNFKGTFEMSEKGFQRFKFLRGTDYMKLYLCFTLEKKDEKYIAAVCDIQSGADEIFERLQKKIQRLKEKNKILKDQVYFAPDGPGYLETKQHFEKLIFK